MPTTSHPDRQIVTLVEYGEADVNLTASQALAFRRLAGNRVNLLPGDAPNAWRIKASSYVGTLVTPHLQVLIRPKVATANLFHLLESGERALSLGAEVFDYDSTGDLIPSFATFYARHLELALAAGVPREYREQEERLLTIRGRVDVPAQRRLAGLALPVECRFDDYTGDTQLARILRAAAVRLLRLPGVTITTRQALRQTAARLAEASDLFPEDVRVETRFTRLNQHCRPAERLARLVLGGSTLLDASGTAGAATCQGQLGEQRRGAVRRVGRAAGAGWCLVHQAAARVARLRRRSSATSAGVTVENLDTGPFTERGGVDGAIRDLGSEAARYLEQLNEELTA